MSIPGMPVSMSISRYIPDAVVFDGSNDFLTRGAVLSGLSNGKQGTISCWINMQGGGNNRLINVEDGASVRFALITSTGSRGVWIIGGNTGGTDILSLETETVPSSAWIHVLISWDLSSPVGHLYVNDSNAENVSETILTNSNIAYTAGDTDFGARTSQSPETNLFNGFVADFWFDDSFIDISQELNRRKFISSNKKPINLGDDGSIPTESSPLIFLSGEVDNWHINKGTGGGFTENGELTQAPNSP